MNTIIAIFARYLVIQALVLGRPSPETFDETKANTKPPYESKRPKITKSRVLPRVAYHRLHAIRKSRHTPVGDEALY